MKVSSLLWPISSSLTCSLALIVICLVESCGSLMCWHCIAENCDGNPEDNHKAEQRHCVDGQVCQKVVFSMQSDVDDTKYKSTVRSCSEDCIPKNDYLNCSNDLYITRGCVKRACCSDSDLCNGAPGHGGPLRSLDLFNLHHHLHNDVIYRKLSLVIVFLLQNLIVFGFLVTLRR